MFFAKSKENEIESVSFTPEEVERLFRRFIRSESGKSGVLDIEELMCIESISKNPLAENIIRIFDENNTNSIDFIAFLKNISVFAKHGNLEQKLKFMFKIYDVNGDNFISNGDIFTVLRKMNGNTICDSKLQQIVDKTMRESNTSRSGKISFEEFKKFVEDNNKDIVNATTLGI